MTNRCLIAEEILDLTDQISQGGKTIYELERTKKILDVEKSDIRAALEEAEVTDPPAVDTRQLSTDQTSLNPLFPPTDRVLWSMRRAKP